jgi:hypothetical protein
LYIHNFPDFDLEKEKCAELIFQEKKIVQKMDVKSRNLCQIEVRPIYRQTNKNGNKLYILNPADKLKLMALRKDHTFFYIKIFRCEKRGDEKRDKKGKALEAELGFWNKNRDLLDRFGRLLCRFCKNSFFYI